MSNRKDLIKIILPEMNQNFYPSCSNLVRVELSKAKKLNLLFFQVWYYKHLHRNIQITCACAQTTDIFHPFPRTAMWGAVSTAQESVFYKNIRLAVVVGFENHWFSTWLFPKYYFGQMEIMSQILVIFSANIRH